MRIPDVCKACVPRPGSGMQTEGLHRVSFTSSLFCTSLLAVYIAAVGQDGFNINKKLCSPEAAFQFATLPLIQNREGKGKIAWPMKYSGIFFEIRIIFHTELQASISSLLCRLQNIRCAGKNAITDRPVDEGAKHLVYVSI